MALAAQRPVHPAARLGLPALDPDIVTLGPHAGLEDQRDPRRDQENAAGARHRRNDQAADDQQDAEAEHRPFDNRIVEKPPPLVPPSHSPSIWSRLKPSATRLRERSVTV